MKIVKNKTLKKDSAKRRGTYNDSPLRYPMNVHMTDTHERRKHSALKNVLIRR